MRIKIEVANIDQIKPELRIGSKFASFNKKMFLIGGIGSKTLKDINIYSKSHYKN